MSTNFQEAILAEVHAFLAPLVEAARSEVGRRRLFAALGWDLEQITGFPIGKLQAALVSFEEAYAGLEALIERPPETFADLETALSTAKDALDAAQSLAA